MPEESEVRCDIKNGNVNSENKNGHLRTRTRQDASAVFHAG